MESGKVQIVFIKNDKSRSESYESSIKKVILNFVSEFTEKGKWERDLVTGLGRNS